MKSIRTIALFVAATFITAGVWAQDHLVKANVPFNFTVSNTALPAGDYTISTTTSSPNLITITDREKNVHMMSLALEDPSTDAKPVLVFHKYGDQYFLSQIRTSALHEHLAVSKAEKRARTQTEEAGIAGSSDVIVALN